jgi:hypothetical protein
VSRPYRIGYSVPDDCRYRRLVLLVQLRLNSRFTPFQGKRSSRAFRYSIFKVLFVFSASLSNKKSLSEILRTSYYVGNPLEPTEEFELK